MAWQQRGSVEKVVFFRILSFCRSIACIYAVVRESNEKEEETRVIFIGTDNGRCGDI